MRHAAVIVGLAVLFAAAVARGAVVYLKNGRTLRGELLGQDTRSIQFRTTAGITVTVPVDQIARVEPGDPNEPASRPTTRPQSTRPARTSVRHSDSCPMDCLACERMFHESLDRLCAEVLRRPAHAPIPVKLGAWPALQVPAASVLGLVLLGEGRTSRPGLHQRTVLRLTRYVSAWAGREHRSTAEHRTWVVAFGTLFLAELHRTAPSQPLRKRIQRLVKLLESARQGSKGWGHRLEPKKTGYGPFVGVTIWCAAALAAAKQQGIDVDEASLKETFAGLRKSIGRSGGAFYFTTGGTGVSVGRTGGVIWVLKAYAGDDDRTVKRGLGFLLRHLQDAPHGHASGMMNFAWSALAVATFGPEVQEAFWKTHRRTLRSARSRSGAFVVQDWKDLSYSDRNDSRPPKESTGTTWPDRMYGDGWATVWMLLSWQAGRGKSVLAGKPAPAGGKRGRSAPKSATARRRSVPGGTGVGPASAGRPRADSPRRFRADSLRLLFARRLTRSDLRL